MKPAHLRTIALGLGGLCAVLGLAILILGFSNRSLQGEVRGLQTQFETQQELINTAITIQQQIIPNLFVDLGKIPDDASIKSLLTKHGKDPVSDR